MATCSYTARSDFSGAATDTARVGEAASTQLREDRRIVHLPVQILTFVLALRMAACAEPLPAMTSDESHRALAPTTALKVRCYDASQTKRERRAVTLVFELQVNDRGQVHTELIASDADDPELIECLRRGFDAYDFPAHRKPTEIRLKFALVPPRATAPTTATPTLQE